jgi:CD80-like C2-set immunoglobulin domain
MAKKTYFFSLIHILYVFFSLSFFAVKPLTVEIMNPLSTLTADQRYELTCESTGSRPNAIITWYKGKRQLRKMKVRWYFLRFFFAFVLSCCFTRDFLLCFYLNITYLATNMRWWCRMLKLHKFPMSQKNRCIKILNNVDGRKLSVIVF